MPVLLEIEQSPAVKQLIKEMHRVGYGMRQLGGKITPAVEIQRLSRSLEDARQHAAKMKTQLTECQARLKTAQDEAVVFRKSSEREVRRLQVELTEAQQEKTELEDANRRMAKHNIELEEQRRGLSQKLGEAARKAQGF